MTATPDLANLGDRAGADEGVGGVSPTGNAPLLPVSSALPVDKRGLLADVLHRLLRAGFVQNAVPVEGVISMQRVWQGPDEDSVIVDSITIHERDQARAVREGDGDGAPTWGPMRGPWSDLVAVFLALPPPDKFVMVLAEGPSVSAAALPGGLS